MLRLAKTGKLPFIPEKYGKWWGNNPSRKMQDDIDVLLIDTTGTRFIICECKFRNEAFDKSEFETMLSANDSPNISMIHAILLFIKEAIV